MVVLVTGANGQLGQAIQSISGKYPEIDFVFCSSSDLDKLPVSPHPVISKHTAVMKITTLFFKHFTSVFYLGHLSSFDINGANGACGCV